MVSTYLLRKHLFKHVLYFIYCISQLRKCVPFVLIENVQVVINGVFCGALIGWFVPVWNSVCLQIIIILQQKSKANEYVFVFDYVCVQFSVILAKYLLNHFMINFIRTFRNKSLQ